MSSARNSITCAYGAGDCAAGRGLLFLRPSALINLARILRYAAWPALRRHLSVRDRPEIAQPVVQDEVDR
jgi:hypothetical protein